MFIGDELKTNRGRIVFIGGSRFDAVILFSSLKTIGRHIFMYVVC